jgi:hypothetical protein
VQSQGPLALGGFRLSQDVPSKYRGVFEPEKMEAFVKTNHALYITIFTVLNSLYFSRQGTLRTFPVPAYASDIRVTSQYFRIFSSNVWETSAVASTLS